ncbi:MAG: hypothetical protein K2H18_07460 [Muribaculaceae bacterium]|nr:hypothetical protein [Muribaculaceae bacterium]
MQRLINLGDMRLRKIILSVLFTGMLTGMLYSCGQRKGRYEIDSLIEDYSEEMESEKSGREEMVDLNAADLEVSAPEAPIPLNDSLVGAIESRGSVISGGLRVRNLGSLAEVFNDSNYRQYAYAEKLGISPITDLSMAYFTKRPMVKIVSNPDYSVDELTHSLPYLVPEASELLSAIGRNFQDSLKSKGRARYRVRVTSLLRTPATVKKLRRVNINATDSSTHQFGTTFDLSYHRFQCLDNSYVVSEEVLKNVLAEVLYDLRREGRCLVKFEKKTGCFHVTVTK